MKTFIVFVKFKAPGMSSLEGFLVRYIDSQWATERHARDRKIELRDSLCMFGVPNFEIEIMVGSVADTAIQELAGETAAVKEKKDV